MFQLCRFERGGSRFESAAPALPFLAETSCFEMILTEMSDLYEFCKSITVFANLAHVTETPGTSLRIK